MKEKKFEQALTRLEEIVDNLEEGELPLEEALKRFEEGIGLSRFCSYKLDQAQQKVEILLADEGGTKKPQPFKASTAEDINGDDVE